MAYTDRTSGAQRTGVMITVALLHGAAAVGLLAAFAGGIIHITPPKRLPIKWFMPVDPPTPEPTAAPTSKPLTHDRERDVTAPTRPIDLGGDTIRDIGVGTGPTISLLPDGGGIDLGPAPTPSPSASFAPIAVRPLGRPGLWVTDNDYPSGALRRGEQGVTGFNLTIGPDGRVRDCVVTRTSGSAELDRATCAKVSARARFAPAMDSSGSAVAATYANTIRWQIPN